MTGCILLEEQFVCQSLRANLEVDALLGAQRKKLCFCARFPPGYLWLAKVRVASATMSEIQTMKRYSTTFREHALEPLNFGKMANASVVGHAELGGPGQFMTLYLRVSGNTIEHASFQTHACGASHACGSVLTELLCGRAVSDCATLSAEDLAIALNGIPPDKWGSAELAIAALQAALGELNHQPSAENPC